MTHPTKTNTEPPKQPQKPTPTIDVLKPIQHTYPYEEFIPELNLNTPKPSPHRVMSSRILEEDTENIRNNLGAIEVDGEYAAKTKGEKCDEITEMLQRSAIAVVESSQSAKAIMDHILAEGVNCLSINPMGGMQHLITFDSFENKKSIMESRWLERWYSTIRNVNNISASLCRETWISVVGMPLIAWGYKNFYNVGSIFGRVISVNQKNFESAKIMIYTDCMFEINTKIAMEIDDITYDIFISERQTHWCSCQMAIPRKQMDSSHENQSKTQSPSSGKLLESQEQEKFKSPVTYDESQKNQKADLGNSENINQTPELSCTNANNAIKAPDTSDSPSQELILN